MKFRSRRWPQATAVLGMSALLAAATLSGNQPSAAQSAPVSQLVFGDAFADGFSVNPWIGTVDVASSSPVQSGSASIRLSLDAWSGVYINIRDGLAIQGASTLSMWVNGGTAGALGVRVSAKTGYTDAGPGFAIPDVPAGTWRKVDVPMSSLVTSPRGFDAQISRSFAVLGGGSNRPAIWIDQIELLRSGPVVTTTTTTTVLPGPTTTTTVPGPTTTTVLPGPTTTTVLPGPTTTTVLPGPTTTAVPNGTCQSRTGPIQVMLVGDSLTVGGYGDGNGGGSDPAKRFRDSYRYELWRLLTTENRSPFLFTGHAGQLFPWGPGWGGEPPIGSGLAEFAHSGVGWISIEEVITQFRSFLAGPPGGHPVAPDVVVVNLGSNIKATPNPRGLVNEIKAALPNSVILLTTMPINLGEVTGAPPAERSALRAEWLAIGNESSSDRVISADIFPVMKAGGSLPGPVLAVDFADATHFNISGGTKFAGAMLAGVRGAIERSAGDRCGTHTPGAPTTTTTRPATTTTTTVVPVTTTTTRPPTTTTTTVVPVTTTTTRPPVTTTTTLPPPPPPPPLRAGVLYDDQLGPNVSDWSWAARNVASTNPARGTRAITFEPDSWSGIVLHAESVTVSANRLRFALHGGSTGGQVIRLFVTVNGVSIVNAELTEVGGLPIAGGWREYTVVFAQPIPAGRTVDVTWQAWTGANQAAVTLDDVSFSS